jgi:NADP-dependent 3-hydroxy acid dehydrogenase YdfG
VGAAVARALSKAGYSLVLTAPSMEKLSALAAQLRGPCTVIEGNLSDENLPETLLYAALDRFGHCDICFNNGALFEAGILETVDIERLSSMVRVNVEGSFRVAYVFLKHFVSEGSGHLVNVSSVLGSSSRPTAYAATQRAIEVLTDALAAELDGTEVLVSCIQPGLVRTGLRHRWEIAADASSGAGYPLEPEDFARMVLFILEQSRTQGRSEEPLVQPVTEEEQLAGENLAGDENDADHGSGAIVDGKHVPLEADEKAERSEAGFLPEEI